MHPPHNGIILDHRSKVRQRQLNPVEQPTQRSNTMACLAGLGSALPARRVTNDELALAIGVDADWIASRTGIQARHIAAEDESATDLAEQASRKAIAAAAIDPAEIDLILVATATPDAIIPSTACLLQARIGAVNAGAIDISAACSGFLYGTHFAAGLIRRGMNRNVLVVGAEVFSRIVDWNDPKSCVLFGDGAGAAIMRPSAGPALVASRTYANGTDGPAITMNMQWNNRWNESNQLTTMDKLYLDGREVFRHAVRTMKTAVEDVITEAGLSMDDVALVVPHQANRRIIEAVAEAAGVPMEKMWIDIEQTANTSAASIPIALERAMAERELSSGNHIVLVAFGGGFTAAAQLWQV